MYSKKNEVILSLLYHEVTNHPDETGFRQPSALSYKHPVDVFKSHLDLVSNSKLEVICLTKDKINISSKPKVTFTFDDGGMSAMMAADLLEERGWIGHFYFITDFLGKKGFLGKTDINELCQRGHIIGSHSHTHPDVFRSLSTKKMDYEWSHSKDMLENILGREVTTASIPGGDMNYETAVSAERAGYSHLFTSEPRTLSWKVGNITCLGRASVTRNTPKSYISRWLNNPYSGLRREQLIRTTKNSVKLIISPLYLKETKRRRHKHD